MNLSSVVSSGCCVVSLSLRGFASSAVVLTFSYALHVVGARGLLSAVGVVAPYDVGFAQWRITLHFMRATNIQLRTSLVAGVLPPLRKTGRVVRRSDPHPAAARLRRK